MNKVAWCLELSALKWNSSLISYNGRGCFSSASFSSLECSFWGSVFFWLCLFSNYSSTFPDSQPLGEKPPWLGGRKRSEHFFLLWASSLVVAPFSLRLQLERPATVIASTRSPRSPSDIVSYFCISNPRVIVASCSWISDPPSPMCQFPEVRSLCCKYVKRFLLSCQNKWAIVYQSSHPQCALNSWTFVPLISKGRVQSS